MSTFRDKSKLLCLPRALMELACKENCLWEGNKIREVNSIQALKSRREQEEFKRGTVSILAHENGKKFHGGALNYTFM